MLNNRCLSLPLFPFHSLSRSFPPRRGLWEGVGVSPETKVQRSWCSPDSGRKLFNLEDEAFGESQRQTVSRYQRAHVSPPGAPPPLLHIPSIGRLSQKAEPRRSEVIYRPDQA